MAGYEIYAFFTSNKDHRPEDQRPDPAEAPFDPPADFDEAPFTLLYKLIDGKMEMVLVQQSNEIRDDTIH